MTDKKILDADQKKNSDEILKEEELEKVSGGGHGKCDFSVIGGSLFSKPNDPNPHTFKAVFGIGK